MDHPILGKDVQSLSKVTKRLGEVAGEMSDRAGADPLQWASYTYPDLLCFGDITMSWRLLDMAIIAQRVMDDGKKNEFYTGKLMQATYFAGVTLPLTMARLNTCIRKGREIVNMPEGAF